MDKKPKPTKELEEKLKPYVINVWHYIREDADPEDNMAPVEKAEWCMDAGRLITIGKMPQELEDEMMKVDFYQLIKAMGKYLKGI